MLDPTSLPLPLSLSLFQSPSVGGWANYQNQLFSLPFFSLTDLIMEISSSSFSELNIQKAYLLRFFFSKPHLQFTDKSLSRNQREFRCSSIVNTSNLWLRSQKYKRITFLWTFGDTGNISTRYCPPSRVPLKIKYIQHLQYQMCKYKGACHWSNPRFNPRQRRELDERGNLTG